MGLSWHQHICQMALCLKPAARTEACAADRFRSIAVLASVALMRSPVHNAIERAQAKGICISVNLDDFIGSHNDPSVLTAAHQEGLVVPIVERQGGKSRLVAKRQIQIRAGSEKAPVPAHELRYCLRRSTP